MAKKLVPADERCTASISGNWPCLRAGTVKEGGKLYCKQHAPSRVKARREAAAAKREARWKMADQIDSAKDDLYQARRVVLDTVLDLNRLGSLQPELDAATRHLVQCESALAWALRDE